MYNSIGKRQSPDVKKPSWEELVIGLDEQDNVEKTVRYRSDSNRFFEHPYTGAVYPLDRMHKWRKIDKIGGA